MMNKNHEGIEKQACPSRSRFISLPAYRDPVGLIKLPRIVLSND